MYYSDVKSRRRIRPSVLGLEERGETRMSDLKHEVAEAHSRGKSLYRDFEARMQKLQAQGLVDCKMKISVDEDTTSAGVVRTLSNVLRLRDEKKGRPLQFNP